VLVCLVAGIIGAALGAGDNGQLAGTTTCGEPDQQHRDCDRTRRISLSPLDVAQASELTAVHTGRR
jgi:hypothetical protein